MKTITNYLLLLFLACMSCLSLSATRIADSDIRDSSSRKIISGSIRICPPGSFSSGAYWIAKDCVSVPISAGAISVTLMPGTYYVHWATSTAWDEQWVVPDSSTPLRLLSVVASAGFPPFTFPHSGLGSLDYAHSGHTGFEPANGNPSVNGMVLASTTAGVRSWVVMSSGGGSSGLSPIATFAQMQAGTAGTGTVIGTTTYTQMKAM